MTAVIAMVCADGALIATDSQATGAGIAQPCTKAKAMPDAPVVWAGSGSRHPLQRVERLLDRNQHAWSRMLSGPSRDALEETVIADIRAEQYRCKEAIRGQNNTCDLLFAGVGEQGPWILDIDQYGIPDWHTDQNFWTVGVPQSFVVMEPFRLYMQPDLTLTAAKPIAYRAITAVSAVCPSLVGGPVQIATVTADGTTQVLDADALAEVAARVQMWETADSSYLTEL